MSVLAGSDELKVEDQRLRQEISGRDASPFLGQQTLAKRVEQALHRDFICHREGAVASLTELLYAHPAVTVTFVASLARTKTGQDGHGAFYKHLEEALGVDELDSEERKRLWRAFRAACIRLGLPVPSLGELHATLIDRYRLEYFVQAGPLHCDLPAMAEAFLAAAEQVGDPDPNDPTSCRQALDAVLIELEGRARALRLVLTNDRAAWHADAFARLRRGAAPRNDFEKAFRQAIEAEAVSRRAHSHGRRPGPPRLVFSEGGIALRAPAMAGWTWTISGPWASQATLGADQELPLGAAAAIRWSAAPLQVDGRSAVSATRDLPVWSDVRMLVFDAAHAGLLGRIVGEPHEIAAEACHVVAHTAFSLLGEACEVQSEETLEGLHVAALALGDGRVKVLGGGIAAEIVLSPRPALAWADESLCALQGKPTFGMRTVTLRLRLPDEEHESWSGRVEAVVTTGRGDSVRRRAPFVEEGGCLTARVEGVGADAFERLQGWAAFAGQERPLLQAPAAWFWPGLERVDNGRFIGPTPRNFNASASRNATIGTDGVVAGLDDGRIAELAFGAGDQLLRLRVETGDVQIELLDRGVARPLRPGAIIVDDGAPKQLRIWCADRNAALDLCGVVERKPFRAGGRRSVALAGLASRGGSRRIEIWPGGDRRRANVLAVVTRPAEPAHVQLRIVGGEPRGEIGLRNGAKLCGHATRLGGECVTLSPGQGLADQRTDAGHAVVRLTRGALGDGFWIVKLYERAADEDVARPLRTPRGDHYAVLGASFGGRFGNAEVVADEFDADMDPEIRHRLFLDVNAALMAPWARESWNDAGLGALDGLWRRYGAELHATEEGRRVMALALGAAPPADANPSWIPLCHPLELDGSLYSGDLDQLAAALVDADDADAREFAHWLAMKPVVPHASAHSEDGAGRQRREACLRFVDRLTAATAGSTDGDTNLERTGNAGRILHAVPIDHARRHRDEAELGDITGQFAIMERVPNFFAAFARAARAKTMAGFLAEVEPDPQGAVRDIGYLLRLGPELLALHLREADTIAVRGGA